MITDSSSKQIYVVWDECRLGGSRSWREGVLRCVAANWNFWNDYADAVRLRSPRDGNEGNVSCAVVQKSAQRPQTGITKRENGGGRGGEGV